MSDSKIEWTDKTWNPVTGCTKVSAGCKNCYAEKMARRLKAMGQEKYRYGFKVAIQPDCLDEPLRWKKPCRVFVCSMGDLFHDDVPDEFIWKVIEAAWKAKHHTFLILTKRAARMRDTLTKSCWWNNDTPQNIHLGVSVEDQATANERIGYLLTTPSAKKFVSIEPMLGPVDLTDISYYVEGNTISSAPPAERAVGASCHLDALDHREAYEYRMEPGCEGALDGVILGCESGPGARSMYPEWARKVRDDCKAAGVPFFLKQMKVDGKLVKMPYLDGVQHKELPYFTSPEMKSGQVSSSPLINTGTA